MTLKYHKLRKCHGLNVFILSFFVLVLYYLIDLLPTQNNLQYDFYSVMKYNFYCSLEIPLYMARKCHPQSSTKTVEWRLIFPLVEKEAMLALPLIQKKAFMLCKFINKLEPGIKWGEIQKPIEPIPTFHWKTAVLWKMDEYNDDEIKCDDGLEVYNRIKDLFHYLYQAYKNKKLNNYFIPDMNLLTKFNEKELEHAELVLKKMLYNFHILNLTTEFQNIRIFLQVFCF